MKNTILATKDGELLEKLIAKHGKVVTSAQIHAEAHHIWDYQQSKNRIQKLVSDGWLIRIKRGLYVMSDLTSRGFLSISPYLVANFLVEESYISFDAALAYWGMVDQFVNQYTSISMKQYKITYLESIRYQFIKVQQKMFTGWESVDIENMSAKIACVEKALVDLIHFRKGRYVVDFVIEKLLNYGNDLDMDRLVYFANLASLKTIKIYGLVFELLGMESRQLFHSLEGDRSTHRISPEDKLFNSKWRIYYDAYFEKYRKEKVS
jgi:predicted transcriptional regulator of viral defense system